jgi:hypothetical protein
MHELAVVLIAVACVACHCALAADPSPSPAKADGASSESSPISLHPENPHYLLFRNRPTVLITSGEHYGAVLNLDFEYIKYLDELKARGFNLTRTFSGSYHELPNSFGIVDNTLAPAAEWFIGPWPRSDKPGAGDGRNKYDLNAWDEAYFRRLKDFVREAGKRGIVVELVLFCTIYDDKLWAIHPFNPANNVQKIGPASRLDVYTLKDKRLQEVQEKMAERIVKELQDFDNVYYEICNEPYFGGITTEWNGRMAKVIAAGEPPGRRHLIAENIANGSAKVKDPNDHVSILNFHYAAPPDAIAANAKLGRATADDETGFKGKGDLVYRAEGWNFLMAGGAIYDNLDYSFTPHHPDGSGDVTTSPGGGGANLRKQLAILKAFVEGLDFIHMTPDQRVVAGGVPEKATVRALVKPGEAYAVYLQGGKQAKLKLELPAGRYAVEWINTKSGQTDKSARLEHSGGQTLLDSPDYSEDIALRVLAIK